MDEKIAIRKKPSSLPDKAAETLVEDKFLDTPQGVFRLRPFGPEQVDAFSALWESAFGRPLDPEVRRWKLENNPFGVLMTLCYAENRDPVACFGGIPYPALYHGRPLRILHAVDNMSHPRYRGVLTGRKGLFVRLVEHFLAHEAPGAHIAFIYGYPGERHYRLGHLMLGYEPLPRSLVPLQFSSGRTPKKAFPWWRIAREIPTEEDLHTLCGLAGKAFPFSVRRDAAYFRWRFLHHPRGGYHVWTCRRLWQRRLRGYVVWKITDRQATLVDIFWDGTDDVAMALVHRSCTDLMSEGTVAFEAWVPQHARLEELFLGLGFRPAQEALKIVPAYVQRPLSPILSPREAARHFYSTMADADLF